MNCVCQSVAKAIGRKPADVYQGVGHGEPIHMAEIIAWLLTQGYAAVPQQTRMSDLDQFPGVIEGDDSAGNPHMVTLADWQLIVNINIVWYFIPCSINPAYVRKHDETLRLGVPPRRVHEWSGRGDGTNAQGSCGRID